ncbi:hypothetical protein KUF71_016387 [Frankliniella fusca]|uniref:Uncharacterized protein n=1 Tax=Frankliniella fusca TaxID=407009 RepID=A0AAE1I4Q6_9NEOP|nr:hypothetical protein KUF71_016387 [Frankliniella fusca]
MEKLGLNGQMTRLKLQSSVHIWWSKIFVQTLFISCLLLNKPGTLKVLN